MHRARRGSVPQFLFCSITVDESVLQNCGTIFLCEREMYCLHANSLACAAGIECIESDFGIRLHCIVKVSQCFGTLTFPSSEQTEAELTYRLFV